MKTFQYNQTQKTQVRLGTPKNPKTFLKTRKTHYNKPIRSKHRKNFHLRRRTEERNEKNPAWRPSQWARTAITSVAEPVRRERHRCDDIAREGESHARRKRSVRGFHNASEKSSAGRKCCRSWPSEGATFGQFEFSGW